MASYSKGILYVSLNSKQKKIYGLSRRDAERLGDKIEQLKATKQTGEMSPELRVWVKKLETENPEMYDTLAGWGLLSERAERKTLGQLLAQYIDRSDVVRSTLENWKKISSNLVEFFGAEKPVDSITLEDADRFVKWLKSAPLNRRGRKPVQYSAGTYKKRISEARSVFNFAEKLGLVNQNPFRFQKSGDALNVDRLEYVPAEKVLKLFEVAPLKWQVIIALGRFAGCRGASEMYRMEWGDISWSSSEGPGTLAIRTKKNERHGRKFRTVPLAPVLENLLLRWAEQAAEGEQLVFPGMKYTQNFSVMLEKLIVRSGQPVWVVPWYNLRKSYCSDLFEQVRDIPVYEHMTDHSYKVAIRHYQILHPERCKRGIDEAFKAFETIEAPKIDGVKNGVDTGWKTGMYGEECRSKETNESAVSACFTGGCAIKKARVHFHANGPNAENRT